jgi:hypothetical protein
MKSLAKIFELGTLAIAIPVVCSRPFLRVVQKGIEQRSVAAVIRASAIQKMAQAETKASPGAQSTVVYGGIHNIAKENGGLHTVQAPVSETPHVPAINVPNVSAPPIHGSDEPPPGYPNYYAPAPLNQPNPYPRNVQPAKPSD